MKGNLQRNNLQSMCNIQTKQKKTAKNYVFTRRQRSTDFQSAP